MIKSKAEDGHDELVLINRVQGGDYAALEELYKLYSRPAFGLALRMLSNTESAEDTVHDAFLKFWKQPALYDPQRGRFLTWLLGVVHNLCIDQLRRKSRLNISLDREEGQQIVAVEDSDFEEEVWHGIRRGLIQQALGQLTPEQRNLIELAYFKGLTRQEIASKTGQPLSTVKNHIRVGLNRLKAIMETFEV